MTGGIMGSLAWSRRGPSASVDPRDRSASWARGDAHSGRSGGRPTVGGVTHPCVCTWALEDGLVARPAAGRRGSV